MKLQQLRHTFHVELDAIYGEDEVRSMFHLLLEHYLNISRVQYAMDPTKSLIESDVIKFEAALQQLKSEVPVQYIIGQTEFFGLPFTVNQSTLIPRPETEELVSWILDLHTKSQHLNILDIGTGSGCIAISLAKHLKAAKVYAMDVSEEALNVAQKNAEINDVEVTFIQNDILNFKTTEAILSTTRFDVIVSNPPYVRNLEKLAMKPNVLDHEPHLALFVNDNNPLQFYDAIANFSKTYLHKDGMLFFEINEYLGQEMIILLKGFNFKDVDLRKDLFGKDRTIKAMQ